MSSPLTDRDFAEIRANVLREIERRRKRRGAFALAGAVAFAVVAIVFVLVPRPMPKSTGEGAGATQKTPAPIAQPVLSGAPAASPVQTAVSTPKPPKHHHHNHTTPPPIAIASYEQKPMTIEMHTANPDIRIIWIAK
jgi:cell division septation protein DedD